MAASLAPEQQQWIEDHLNSDTHSVVVTGKATSHEVLDNGIVRFTVESSDGNTATFLAWPPPTDEQRAEMERQAEAARIAAEEEAQRQADEQAAIEAEQRERDSAASHEQAEAMAKEARAQLKGLVRDLLNEVLAEEGLTRGDATPKE